MERIEKKLSELTGHKNIRLVNSGNAAILAAFCIIKKSAGRRQKTILMPDQGGWISFRTYPKIFGFSTREVLTDKGIIDIEDLKKKARTAAAFIVTSFAGYYAEQPMKEISKACRKAGCILIEDASGAVGINDGNDGKICNGDYSDIIVGSFGRWKPVTLGNGGFISTDEKRYLEKAEELFSALKFSGDPALLLRKLNDANRRINLFIRTSEKVKKDLKKEGISIFHPEKRGLNVVAGFRSSAEKERIARYCTKNNYECVICPKDIRVNEKAISIEIKRNENI